ncbi:hypothetical protein AAE02nite_31740 [Adhaeribacter aerolatus]|uniref:Bacterial mobilisation domain-containing protein n=1 Tax=Adhaeribacter aerolatus TaxID=670289 RepID=A0A512B0M2_9BACT|nr:hypothetical protein [Adhaeribacter aerolatus]GEO05510.1 hypothetical protein AAE02nite_31740 [Adhaeribacter aerolatus]
MEKEEPASERKKGRGGRKPKPDHERAKNDIHFRVTDAELKYFEELFLKSSYNSKSDMFHDMAFNKTLRIKDSTGVILATEMQNLIREIKDIGTNYNQVVKKVNSLTQAKPVPPELTKLIWLTEKLEEKQNEFYKIILQLREKWLQG